MSVRDKLGDRMKTYYEAIPKIKLYRKIPVAIRLDMRVGWVIDNEIPLFKDEGRKYIEDRISVCEDAVMVRAVLDKLAEKPNRVLYPDGDLSSGLMSPEDIKKWIDKHPEIKELANKAQETRKT